MDINKDNINNNDFVYDEKYDEKLMDHDYDGIKELDNPAPAWIMAMFYITISFAVVYGVYYFLMDTPTQQEEWKIADKLHKETYKDVNKSTNSLVILEDAASLTDGEKIFKQSCAMCHGVAGEGKNGVNLTDNSWIYGCDFQSVFKLVKNGNVAKTMPAFNSISNTDIQKTVSYILVKLKGTTPENAKEAEGEKCN